MSFCKNGLRPSNCRLAPSVNRIYFRYNIKNSKCNFYRVFKEKKHNMMNKNFLKYFSIKFFDENWSNHIEKKFFILSSSQETKKTTKKHIKKKSIFVEFFENFFSMKIHRITSKISFLCSETLLRIHKKLKKAYKKKFDFRRFSTKFWSKKNSSNRFQTLVFVISSSRRIERHQD